MTYVMERKRKSQETTFKLKTLYATPKETEKYTTPFKAHFPHTRNL